MREYEGRYKKICVREDYQWLTFYTFLATPAEAWAQCERFLGLTLSPAAQPSSISHFTRTTRARVIIGSVVQALGEM